MGKDLEIDPSVLYRCVKFVEAYPRFEDLAAKPQFNWTHYRHLVTIPDDKTRVSFMRRAEKGGWRTARALFTYKAFVERAVDGDTLVVKIDLGFETRIRSDKYDRYLADVF